MNQLDILQLIIGEIESVVDVPVRMSNTDEEHEMDKVLIDNLNTNRRQRSTNPYIGVERDDGGNPLGERLKFYFDARLDITVQSEKEETAFQLRQTIAEHFRVYEKYPKDLAQDITMFELGKGGDRETEFEPTVFRLFKQNQTFHFSFTDEQVIDSDVIETIEDNL